MKNKMIYTNIFRSIIRGFNALDFIILINEARSIINTQNNKSIINTNIIRCVFIDKREIVILINKSIN